MSGSETHGRLVRPYAITGGRSGGQEDDVALEAQIEITAEGRAAAGKYRWEAAGVIELCSSPMAVVEIAAHLQIPLGVARVIVGDLVRDGAARVAEDENSYAYTDLLQRVLDGIRSL